MALDRFVQRTIESAGAAEIYLTAANTAAQFSPAQVESAYGQVRKALVESGGRIFHERVFVAAGGCPTVAEVRRALLGGLDDGLPPTMLLAPPGPAGQSFGLRIHAVRGPAPAPIREASAAGRIIRHGDVRHIMIGPLTAAKIPGDPGQARAVFGAANSLLVQIGCDMRAVARTWLWLGDILSWYGELNQVRNRFFTEAGLLDDRAGNARMPASTGIGVFPADGGQCTLELRAVAGGPGRDDLVRLHSADGRQDSPYRYGSAFSRAATAISPAGRTLFVSGTAAIDTAGRSLHPGDARLQIEATLANVRALLAGHGFEDRDVVSAIAYCKTPAVETIWNRDFLGQPSPARRDETAGGRANLTWPIFTMIANVCRAELLFELELTACRPGGE